MTSDPRTPGAAPHDAADDAAVFAALRRTWQHVDPVPVELIDDVVAAVASADLGREYALLTLVDSDATSAVRGDADMLTMQFSDGQTNVLVHTTPGASTAGSTETSPRCVSCRRASNGTPPRTVDGSRSTTSPRASRACVCCSRRRPRPAARPNC